MVDGVYFPRGDIYASLLRWFTTDADFLDHRLVQDKNLCKTMVGSTEI